jgi:3-methyl-2-oxobutanoate hydroxymethyltransferase
MTGRISVRDFQAMKNDGKKIVGVTAYDFSLALLMEEAGVDMILVGDSGGMVILGYDSTIPVTMQEMLFMCRAVTRATKTPLVIGDMPFMSYEVSPEEAVTSAGLLVKEGGVNAVKLEGGKRMVRQVEAIVNAGIPVMGHIGITPQTSAMWDGFRLQGKESQAAMMLIEDAKALEKAGVFSIVLEVVSSEVASTITSQLTVPTIGVGSGPDCSGQLLVLHDLLGLYEKLKPKFVKRYAEIGQEVRNAIKNYAAEVRGGVFPQEQQTRHMDPEELKKFTETLRRGDR